MFSSQNSQVSNAANYIEDVFSTYLYTGNGATQTITNGIDLSTKGGLVWAKDRTQATDHQLSDSAIGPTRSLSSSLTLGAGNVGSTDITGFTSSGFTLGYIDGRANSPGSKVASWTFRKQPKFFDVVTYTGDGTSSKTIAHNLGSAPGCIIIKALSGTYNWAVYHRGLSDPTGKAIYLDLTNAESASDSRQWNNTAPTSTNFTVGTFWNTNNVQFVAYLFAHDAGGFGTAGTDNVISCGTFTSDGSGLFSVNNLGYEPQWLLAKRTDTAGAWYLIDNMRGFAQAQQAFLNPNTTAADNNLSGLPYMYPTATGFGCSQGVFGANGTFIYIAIRRGPMKVPTDGTKVFSPVAFTGAGTNPSTITAAITPDLFLSKRTDSSSIPFFVTDRLRGGTQVLSTSNAIYSTEATDASWVQFDKQTTIAVEDSWLMGSGGVFADLFFRRAPSVFDVVCYSGTGTAKTVSHNLQAAPELILLKGRDIATDWNVYSKTVGATGRLTLNYDLAAQTNSVYWNDTAPTSSVFTVGTGNNTNGSGYKYVAYLFSSCDGVSKVGTYTGTGTTKQINCGFTAGARFVLIKRTDSTGDWYVWDSARGIVSGNDPYLLLNTTDVEVTSTDYIDAYSAGFELSSTAPAAINASGGTFIFLAIA